jgi:hypothetical protein
MKEPTQRRGTNDPVPGMVANLTGGGILLVGIAVRSVYHRLSMGLVVLAVVAVDVAIWRWLRERRQPGLLPTFSNSPAPVFLPMAAFGITMVTGGTVATLMHWRSSMGATGALVGLSFGAYFVVLLLLWLRSRRR